MSERLTQLQRLADELHVINQELSRAARPLNGQRDLNDVQKQEIGARLRAGLARWDDVTREISKVLRADSSNGSNGS